MDRGVDHRFGPSTKYDLVYEGRRYPPKAVVGLAAERLAGRVLEPADFTGGQDSKSFRILEKLGFAVEPKAVPDEDSFDQDPDAKADRVIFARTDIGPRTKQTLGNARRGQGLFRERVIAYEGKCGVTGVDAVDHLRASHIKPWKDSTDDEKLDGNNRLLLAPHVEHLFDQGSISFTDFGDLMVSTQCPKAVLTAWGIDEAINVGPIRLEQRPYLAYHRQMHGFK